jgi:hypothetical protein
MKGEFFKWSLQTALPQNRQVAWAVRSQWMQFMFLSLYRIGHGAETKEERRRDPVLERTWPTSRWPETSSWK